jgi:hypothetical protein
VCSADAYRIAAAPLEIQPKLKNSDGVQRTLTSLVMPAYYQVELGSMNLKINQIVVLSISGMNGRRKSRKSAYQLPLIIGVSKVFNNKDLRGQSIPSQFNHSIASFMI